MSAKPLGFSDYELTTAKNQAKRDKFLSAHPIKCSDTQNYIAGGHRVASPGAKPEL